MRLLMGAVCIFAGVAACDDGLRISLSTDAVTITAYDNAAPASVRIIVEFRGDGVLAGLPPGDPEPGWLSLVPISNTEERAHVDLLADPALAPRGINRATLRFLTGDVDTLESVTTDLEVTFHVLEPFAVSTPALELSTTLDGASGDPRTELGITGAQSSWQITDVPPWLALDRTEGTGAATLGASCSKAVFAVPAVAKATVRITDTVGGRAISLPVRCIADPHRLLLSRHGLAFSKFADAARLTADVEIGQNGDREIPWSASTTTSWLSVTAGGQTGQTGQRLSVTANATGLPPGFHHGTVTVTSGASTISRVETIRVGLYVSSAALPPTVVHSPSLGASGQGDPIRPYIYVFGNQLLQARNIYTGAVEKTYALPPLSGSRAIGDVSDDGKYLYVVAFRDYNPSNPLAYYARQVYRVHLDNEAEAPILLFTEEATTRGHSNGPFPVKYFRNGGVPVLFNPIGRLHRADTGEVLTTFQWNWDSGASPDQWSPVYRETGVSVHRSGKYIALAKLMGIQGDNLQLYGVRVHDVAGAPAELKLELSTGAPAPGAMLLGDQLDRIYLSFGYLEKTGTGWVHRPGWNYEQVMIDAGGGVLFGTGDTGTHTGATHVAEYTKDGAFVRSLSSSGSWYFPWLSSDGLMVVASQWNGSISSWVLHAFRR